MADTIREKIIQEITTGIKAIRTANGYNSDAGQLVERGPVDFAEEELPATAIFPQPETASRQYGNTICVMPLHVQVSALLNGQNASVLSEQILGDIIKCVCNLSHVLTFDLEYEGGGTESYPSSDDISVKTTALFNITYKFLAGNPYQQP